MLSMSTSGYQFTVKLLEGDVIGGRYQFIDKYTTTGVTTPTYWPTPEVTSHPNVYQPQSTTHFEFLTGSGDTCIMKCKVSGTYTFTYNSNYAGNCIYPEQ